MQITVLQDNDRFRCLILLLQSIWISPLRLVWLVSTFLKSHSLQIMSSWLYSYCQWKMDAFF